MKAISSLLALASLLAGHICLVQSAELNIGGAAVPEPNSMFFFGANRWGSAAEVPAHDQDFYALKNVPHGKLREVLFHSKSTDKFSHIGLFSGGNIRPDDIADMAAFKAKNKLVFVSYGSREERGATAAREGTDALKPAGINSHHYESPETAHEWQSWRRSLYQIAPLLFQN